MSKFLTRNLVKLNLATLNSSLFSSIESGEYTSRNLKSARRSATNTALFMLSLSLSTADRLDHISSSVNFPPRSFLPALTPFTIIPAISLIRLLGYFSTTVFMSARQPSASPLFSFPSPPIKRNLSLLAPSGNLVSEILVLAATSPYLSSLKALYVAA